MSELQDIFGKGKGRLPEDKLMAYLEGKLSPEEQHEVEAWLAEEGMESDALDGLKEMPPAETKQMVNHLNRQLHHNLRTKPRRRKAIADNKWAWLAVVIILLLCIVAYVVLKMAL